MSSTVGAVVVAEVVCFWIVGEPAVALTKTLCLNDSDQRDVRNSKVTVQNIFKHEILIILITLHIEATIFQQL